MSKHQYNPQQSQIVVPKSPWTQETPTEPGAYFYESKRWGHLMLELKDGVFYLNCGTEGLKVVRPSDGLWCKVVVSPIPEDLRNG